MEIIYKNVVDKNGEDRIAAIQDGEWVSISAGIASLEGREYGMAPYGTQCNGSWLGRSPVTDQATGKVYPCGVSIKE